MKLKVYTADGSSFEERDFPAFRNWMAPKVWPRYAR